MASHNLSSSQRPPITPIIPLWNPTTISGVGARASMRRGIFTGVQRQLDKEGGIAPWFLPTWKERRAAFDSNLVDALDALYDMDLRHDIAIMAFIGPIEAYSQDDRNPQNAQVITFLSRSIQQSTSPTIQQIVAHARDDFLNGIARPHVLNRASRYDQYERGESLYAREATLRLQRRAPQDPDGSGPWTVNIKEYRKQLHEIAIGGTKLDGIDPLMGTPSRPASKVMRTQQIVTTPSTPSPFSPSVVPIPPSAAAPPSQTRHSLTQRLNALSLTPRLSDNAKVDHKRWGVASVPAPYRILPAVDFILASLGVDVGKVAMVKCILSDERCNGDQCITKLEEIPLDFSCARIIAYVAGRLDNNDDDDCRLPEHKADVSLSEDPKICIPTVRSSPPPLLATSEMPAVRTSPSKASPMQPYSARKKRRPIPQAERKAKKAVQDAKKDAILEKLNALWESIITFARTEAPSLGISVDDLIEKVLALGRSKYKKRAINLWNAHQHQQAQKRKTELAAKIANRRRKLTGREPGSSKQARKAATAPNSKDTTDSTNQATGAGNSDEDQQTNDEMDQDVDQDSPELVDESDDDGLKPSLHLAVQGSKNTYHSAIMGAEEAQTIKKRLASHREEKERAVKKQYLTHGADVRKTLDWIDQEVQALGHRCSIQIICIAVRTKLEHRVVPRVIGTAGAKKYFQMIFKDEPLKFGWQMENYFTNGIFGTRAKNANQRQTNLKANIRGLLTEALRTVTDESTIQFPWTDFFIKITEGYQVILRGWPLPYFANPSDFKTKADLESVRDALLSGSCHFVQIDEKEVEELKVKRAHLRQSGVKETVGIELAGGNVAVSITEQRPSDAPANRQPSVSLTPPPPPIPTFQSTFQVAPTGYEGIEPSLWPPSAFLTQHHMGQAQLPVSVPPSLLQPSIAEYTSPLPGSSSHDPLPTPVTTVPAAEDTSKKRSRWDSGLDRDLAREVKEKAGEANISPSEYLAQHPELYQRAKDNKRAKQAKKIAS